MIRRSFLFTSFLSLLPFTSLKTNNKRTIIWNEVILPELKEGYSALNYLKEVYKVKKIIFVSDSLSKGFKVVNNTIDYDFILCFRLMLPEHITLSFHQEIEDHFNQKLC